MAVRHFIYVCASCDVNRARADTPDAKTGKAMLAAVKKAVAQAELGEQVVVKSIKCMGGCEQACSVGFNAPGKQACLFVGMRPDAPQEVLAVLRQYMASPIGRVRSALFPEGFKARYLARIPQAR